MVLESDRRECIAKKSPPSPSPAKAAEPFRPFDRRWSLPCVLMCRVDRQTASTARAKPSLFQPPFPGCRIGQIGLLVRLANFAMLESVRPTLQASTRVCNRFESPRSAYQVADQAMQLIHSAKPTVNSRLAGSRTSQANNPASEDICTQRMFLITRDRSGAMPRRSGEIVDMTITSYP